MRAHLFLRFIATLSAVLLAFAAVADSEASCPAGDDDASCLSAAAGDDAPPASPCQDCAGRPCRTPVSVAPAASIARVLGTVSTFVTEPVETPICAEPVAPPTPPPLART